MFEIADAGGDDNPACGNGFAIIELKRKAVSNSLYMNDVVVLQIGNECLLKCQAVSRERIERNRNCRVGIPLPIFCAEALEGETILRIIKVRGKTIRF